MIRFPLPTLLLTTLLLIISGCGGQDTEQPTGTSPFGYQQPQPRVQPRTCNEPISTTPVVISLQPMGQICQQWCWSATLTMVANYYGKSINICVPPSVKTGLQCCNWAACSNQICNQPATTNEMANHFVALGVHGRVDPRALTEKELQTEISNGRPVIIAYQSSFSGHVVLVMGFSPGKNGVASVYRVVDPYYGIFDVPYKQVRYGYNNGSFTWASSFWKLRLETEEPCN